MSRRHLGFIYPPGTCQTPSFYWRGGDKFKEPEHLQSAYINAKSEHTKAKKELEEVKKEYQQVSEMLSNKDKQAVALASSLGGESQMTGENAELSRQIADLTLEISEIEEKITEASNRALPTYIAQLERERSTTYLAVERFSHEMENMEKELKDIDNEYYSLLTSDEWVQANNVCSQYQLTSKERSKLRQEVKNAFEDQNYAKSERHVIQVNDDSTIGPGTKEKSVVVLKKNQTVRVKSSENEHIEMLYSLTKQRDYLVKAVNRAQHNRYMAQAARKIMVSTKLDMISQLNNALVSLNQEEIKVVELQEKYLPEGVLPQPRVRPATTMAKAKLKSPKSTRRPLTQNGRK